MPRGIWWWSLMAACSGNCGDDPTPLDTSGSTADTATTDCTNDADADGLTDCEELELGTATQLADTDGDGLDDGDEVARETPGAYDPRIADAPRLTLALDASPRLSVAVGTEVFTTPESTTTPITRPASLLARAVELSVLPSVVPLTLGDDVALSDGALLRPRVRYTPTVATADDLDFVWAPQDVQAAIATLDDALAEADAVNGDLTDFRLAVTFDVGVASSLPVTLRDLQVDAFLVDPFVEDLLVPLGPLSPMQMPFGELQLGPDAPTGNLVFESASLPEAIGRQLFTGTRGLVFRITDHAWSDGDRSARFADDPEVLARTATIVVDEIPGVTPVRAQVATTRGDDPDGIPAIDALRDVIGVAVDLDQNEWVESIDGQGLGIEGQWVAVLARGGDIERTPVDVNLRFDEIQLQAGDVLHLVWTEDQDADGLGTRTEAALGTSAIDVDSDGDGITDDEELLVAGTDPTEDDRIVCPGENYDVDGIDTNGCEVADTVLDNHSRATATDLGGRSCEDSNSDPNATGLLVSDRALHDPPVPGFDAAVGAAPDWFRIFADGGPLCQNDIVLSLSVSGPSTGLDCYELTVFTNVHPGGLTCRTDATGTCLIDRTFGEYGEDTDVHLRIARVCPPDGAAASYTVNGHL